MLERLHQRGGLVSVLCDLPKLEAKAGKAKGAASLPHEGLGKATGAEPLPRGVEGDGFAVHHFGAVVSYAHLGKGAKDDWAWRQPRPGKAMRA